MYIGNLFQILGDFHSAAVNSKIICENCLLNTIGDRCEQCKPGFWKRQYDGSSWSCVKYVICVFVLHYTIVYFDVTFLDVVVTVTVMTTIVILKQAVVVFVEIILNHHVTMSIIRLLMDNYVD